MARADGKVWIVAEETLYGAREVDGFQRPMRAYVRVTRAAKLTGYSERWFVGLDVRTAPYDRSGEPDGQAIVLLVPFSLGYQVPSLSALMDCRAFVLESLANEYGMGPVGEDTWNALHDAWEAERRAAKKAQVADGHAQ